MRARPADAVRPAVALQLLFVFFGVVVAAFFPFFALFLKERGLKANDIGLVIAAMAVARVLTNPLWGHLSDTTFGRRTMLQMGLLLGGVLAVALFVYGHGLVAIVVLSAVFAGVGSVVPPNIDAIALAHLGDERMSDYGRIRGWESMSYAISSLVIGVILQAAGVPLTLVVYAVASLAVLAWSWTIRADEPARTDHGGKLGAVGAVFRESPRFWAYLGSILFVWFGFAGAWNFISLKIERGGGGPLLVGLGTALGGAVEVPVMRASSGMQMRFGLRKVYVAGCVVYATGFLLWGLISNPTIVSILTIFEGFGFGLLFTSGVVIVGKLVPASLYSTGQSMASTVGFGVSPILGGAIGGEVYHSLGPVALYVGASALTLIGAGLAWLALATPTFTEPLKDAPSIEPGAEPNPGIVP
jgi:MFS transporter, PPP family, 3-phenylpropionic acid transporter